MEREGNLRENMTESEKIVAFDALLHWEHTGELPDHETGQLLIQEHNQLCRLTERLRNLLDACHAAEHLRLSPANSWTHWSEIPNNPV